MKRALFIGDLRDHTRTSQRLRALRRLGLEVVTISSGGSDRPPPLHGRILRKLGKPLDGTGANRALLETLEREAFDLLWIDKAPPVRTTTLRAARLRRPEMAAVYFSEDDMMMRHNQTAWFRASLPLYDLVVTTKQRNANGDELPALGAPRVLYVAKTFDPEVHRPVALEDGDREGLGGEVGFIGTFEEERAAALLTLARSGLCVRVWGNGWGGWRNRHERMRVEGRAIYGEEYVRSICATDVNLGFLRRLNRDRHTDRSVEIPACGAFLLAERTDEHEALFREGVEADYFDGLLELCAKVQTHLGDPEARARIAAAGRARCLRDDYGHDGMLRRVLAELGWRAHEEAA